MSRDIRFRAWWKDTMKPIPDFMTEYLVDACNDEVFIVSQFTGLRDKNGKEIWEGDVVTWGMDELVDAGERIVSTKGRGEVAWISESAHFGFKQPGRFGHFIMEDMKLEVLGNIYENPELLKP